MTMCLFGHRDAPADAGTRLKCFLKDLILKHGEISVLVGQQGAFDRMAAKVLCELSKEYAGLRWSLVLTKLPEKDNEFGADTVLPEGIENVYPRFAINWRNNWMIRQSDMIVVYMARNFGGVSQAVKYARSQQKQIINLAEK